MTIGWTISIAGVLVLLLTIELLRRRQLREKYAAIWLVVGCLAVVSAFAPHLLESVARALGFSVPANLVFALAVLVLLMVGMQLSLEVGRLEDETQRLAEEIALLRHEFDVLSGDESPWLEPPPVESG